MIRSLQRATAALSTEAELERSFRVDTLEDCLESADFETFVDEVAKALSTKLPKAGTEKRHAIGRKLAFAAIELFGVEVVQEAVKETN